jgi:alpha-ketoglutarate-dependent taurine dioxygenase
MFAEADGFVRTTRGHAMSLLAPFGALIEARSPERDLRGVDGTSLRAMAERHGLVVLRGFSPLPREAFVAYAATLGEIYTWEFGAVLDLVAHDDPKNYLFARGSVPFHWDGAFREEVPGLQIFQCVRAPLPGHGGETEFCDTTRVVARATAAERARWEPIVISYATEKVAHYGGSIYVRLLARHPRTGARTLRIGLPNDAETSPENPVAIRVVGLADEESDAFLAGMRERLHDPEHCYTHAWRDGDFLVADNHALVHGRRAFVADAPRHLERVHVR